MLSSDQLTVGIESDVLNRKVDWHSVTTRNIAVVHCIHANLATFPSTNVT